MSQYIYLNKLYKKSNLNVDWNLFFVGCVMGCSNSCIFLGIYECFSFAKKKKKRLLADKLIKSCSV